MDGAHSQDFEAPVSPGSALVSESPSPIECTLDDDMMSDADGDFEIDDEYEGLVSLVCSGGCAVSSSAAASTSGSAQEADVEMDFENEGSYSEGTSDSSDDFELDGPFDEMREYEFKLDIKAGVQQLNSAAAADGMELEFTLPDYSPTSPSDASSPSPSPTPSPTSSSFPACDTSSSSNSLLNHLQLDTSSDSLLDFPSPSPYALDTFRRPFSPFMSLNRFPAHCLRDSMQPVLGLGTPDNGMGRKEWGKASTPSPLQTPPSTPISVFDTMGGQVVNAEVTDTIMSAFSPEPSPSSSVPVAASGTSPELLGLFGYAVDISANLGYSSSSVSSSLECAVGVSAEGVIGGL